MNNNTINLAREIIAEYDNYEVFCEDDDIANYLPTPEELDKPIPDIWEKRIAACTEISAYKSYPCIFDTLNCVIESYIDADGFTLNGRRYTA